MRARRRGYDTASRVAAAAPLEGDGGLLERMAALGYVGGPVTRGGAGAGADPKDTVKEVQRYRDDAIAARQLFATGHADEGLRILDRLARTGVATFDEQKLRGTMLLEHGRYAEALKSLEVALRMVPHFDQLYVDVAQAHLGLGRRSEARDAIERGLAIEPGNSLLLTAKGGLLQELGDLQGARAVLESARTADPADVRVRVQLGHVYRSLGKNGLTVDELQATTRLEP